MTGLPINSRKTGNNIVDNEIDLNLSSIITR